MKFKEFFVIVALFGLSINNEESLVCSIKILESEKLKDFNGADEDDIMDKVFSKYSTEGKDHNGVKMVRKSFLSQLLLKLLVLS